MQHQLLVIQEEKVKTNDESNNNSVEISICDKSKVNPLGCCCKKENVNLSETNGIGQMLKDILSSSLNTMPWILSKIISSEAVAEEVLFLRKSKAELVLTNLKTFDTFVFHNYQK